MNNKSIIPLRAAVIDNAANLNWSADQDEWLLLGTSNCHLCEIAKEVLACFQSVQPIIYHNVDIANFDEPLMMVFATKIPVLLTPLERLDYPFSVVDLQRLL